MQAEDINTGWTITSKKTKKQQDWTRTLMGIGAATTIVVTIGCAGVYISSLHGQVSRETVVRRAEYAQMAQEIMSQGRRDQRIAANMAALRAGISQLASAVGQLDILLAEHGYHIVPLVWGRDNFCNKFWQGGYNE